jgi:hypothetical protein
MNLFDPALEEGLTDLLNGIQSSAQQANAVPSVSGAISSLGGHLNKFLGTMRQQQLDAILTGQSPKAVMALMIKPHTNPNSFKWNLITPGKEQHLFNKPAWAIHQAFCSYLRWLDRKQSAEPIPYGPNEMPLTDARIRQGYHSIGYPRRVADLPDGFGLVHVDHSIPALNFAPICISSAFEGLPKMISNFQSVEFQFNHSWFFSEYFERAYNYMAQEAWDEVPFPIIQPKVAGEANYEDITIRVKDFILIHNQEGDGISFVDGIITLKRESWQKDGYAVVLSAPLACLMAKQTHGVSMDWTGLARPLQMIINQLTLMKVGDREEYGIFEGDDLQVAIRLINPNEYVVDSVVRMEVPEKERERRC